MSPIGVRVLLFVEHVRNEKLNLVVDADPAPRIDGYAPIGHYAVIGDSRSAALVAWDGAIDWLCWPNFDSPSVFGRLLDADRGGTFELRPSSRYTVERRYVPRTNVLETIFHTADGSARVTDALTLPLGDLPPMRELVRRVEGLSGRVPMSYRVSPRFGYARAATRLGMRGSIPVADSGGNAVALCTWETGKASLANDDFAGRFKVRAGGTSTLALVSAYSEPLVFPGRDAVEARMDGTRAHWEDWSRSCFSYQGRWEDAVLRSALAIKLLVFAPSGAVTAAATTSLPEEIGGERNFDYRFCWIRDSAFALSSMLRLGCVQEAEAFAWWFMHATALTKPQIQVLYQLDGGNHVKERELALEGYRGSRPVRQGNAAGEQTQIDVYGSLLQTAWVYAQRDQPLDRETAKRYGSVTDYICEMWQQPDAGIWEVRSEPRQFTHSKLMCWVGLDRALRLAEKGHLRSRNVGKWRAAAGAIREFIERECWSDRKQSYTRSAGSEELDASLLLMPVFGYAPGQDERQRATIEAIRRELSDGFLVRRYTGEDGLTGGEGYFLACSFWMVHALALSGAHDEAREMMDDLVRRSNDVGLYAEEIESTNEMLGNFPQALTHLALIHAAVGLSEDHNV